MRRYRYLIVAAVTSLFIIATIIYRNNVYTYIKDPYSFVEYLQSLNIYKATLILSLANYLQVILAFIPAGPFEIVAGIVYGPIIGTIISDIVMTLGSISIYLLVKKFGKKVIELFVDINEIEKLNFLKDNKKLSKILFLIFLIPGSPKDVISYGVGLTDLSLKSWFIISLIGRIPSIFLTILSASCLAIKKYEIGILIIIIFATIYIIGIKLYKKLNVK